MFRLLKVVIALSIGGIILRSDQLSEEGEQPPSSPEGRHADQPPAKSDPIMESCNALRQLDIPIDLSVDGSQEIRGSAAGFMETCHELFRVAEEYQRRVVRITPRLWSAETIREIHVHVRDNGLVDSEGRPKVAFWGSRQDVGGGFYLGGQYIFGYTGSRIQAGLFSPAPATLEDIYIQLDHELGHHRDHQLLAKVSPEVETLMGARMLARSDIRRFSLAVLDHMVQNIPPEKREAFRRKAGTLLLPPYHFGIDWHTEAYGTIMEMLRYGEEIDDPRFQDDLTRDDLPPGHFLITDDPTDLEISQGLADQMRNKDPEYLARCLLMAKSELMGRLAEFRRHYHDQINPLFFEYVDPADVAFFKDGILASRDFLKSQTVKK